MHKVCASLQLTLRLPSASSHPNLVTINKLKHGALATAWLFAAKPCRFNNPIIVYVPNCISRFNNCCTKRLWKVFQKLVSFSQSGIRNGQRKSEPVMLMILEVFSNLNNFIILLLVMVITQELSPFLDKLPKQDYATRTLDYSREEQCTLKQVKTKNGPSAPAQYFETDTKQKIPNNESYQKRESHGDAKQQGTSKRTQSHRLNSWKRWKPLYSNNKIENMEKIQ